MFGTYYKYIFKWNHRTESEPLSRFESNVRTTSGTDLPFPTFALEMLIPIATITTPLISGALFFGEIARFRNRKTVASVHDAMVARIVLTSVVRFSRPVRETVQMWRLFPGKETHPRFVFDGNWQWPSRLTSHSLIIKSIDGQLNI